MASRNDGIGYGCCCKSAIPRWAHGWRALIPRASVAWQHAFGDVTPTAALSFQSIGAGFNILGVPTRRSGEDYIRGDLALLAAVSAQRLAIRMGSMGASVLKILQDAHCIC
jgi:hypothetical protein